MTHNLRDWFMQRGAKNQIAYAKEFRDWIDVRVHQGPREELLDWQGLAPNARRAHPTPEHFLPLFVALGAAGEGYRVESVFSGYDSGVLAMDAYRFT
jgi:4,5-DOPA dioxygenase extradiol